MSKLNRIAVILLLSQPLVVGTGAAYAFSTVESDSMPGASLAEPGAQFDNLSEQYWSSWGQPKCKAAGMTQARAAELEASGGTPPPLTRVIENYLKRARIQAQA